VVESGQIDQGKSKAGVACARCRDHNKDCADTTEIAAEKMTKAQLIVEVNRLRAKVRQMLNDDEDDE
jgi:hypothetical protein